MAKYKRLLLKIALFLFAFLPLSLAGLVSAQAVVQQAGAKSSER